MELGLKSCSFSPSINAAESTVEVVDGFLSYIVEKVAMNIEDLRLKQPNAKLKSDGKIEGMKIKQVHFSSPLVTASHSEPDNVQSQDTLILTPEDYAYEDTINSSDSEDEVRRKFVEEGDGFVPEMKSSPSNLERNFEFDSLFFSKLVYQDRQESSQSIAEKDKSARILALDKEKKDPNLTATSNHGTILKSTISFSDAFSIVPGSNIFRSSKNHIAELKPVVEFDADLQEGHTYVSDEKKKENCLGLQKDLSLPGCFNAEKRSSQDNEDEKVTFSPILFDGCGDKMIGHPQIMLKKQDIDLKKTMIDNAELVVNECKIQFEDLESKVQGNVKKIVDFKTKPESPERNTLKLDVLRDSEEDRCAKSPCNKRKSAELPVLIYNDTNSSIDLEWQAEVRKKKSKPSYFNINEQKEGLESCYQLGMKQESGESCSRPVLDFINVEDQLVPDVVTDAKSHSSTAEIVLSNLDPQPYPMSIFGASCSPPLQECRDAFTSVVPDCQALEHFMQASKSMGSPKLANQEAGDIDSTTADVDVIMDASESSSIEVVLSSGDDTFLAESADLCGDGSVLKRNECVDNVELHSDEELQMKTRTVCMTMEGESKAASAKIRSIFKDIDVDDVVYSEEECQRCLEEVAVDSMYSQENHDKRSEEEVGEVTEPANLMKKVKLESKVDVRDRKESKENEKLSDLKEDKKNCKKEGLCLSTIISEYQKEDTMKVENAADDAVDVNGGEEPSELRQAHFVMLEGTEKRTLSSSVPLQESRRIFSLAKRAENESREVVIAESDLKNREFEENSPGGSEGFEIHLTPWEISMQIDRELQSAQTMLIADHPQDNLESFIKRKSAIRRDIGEETEGVVEGINEADQDQNIEITPTFEYHDVKFYDEDLCGKSQSGFPGKPFKTSSVADPHEVKHEGTTSLVQGVRNNSSAFSWSASEKALWKNVHDSNRSSQGSQMQSSSNESTVQQADQRCVASSKRAPSQGIIRLGLSKRTQVKRLHPYFTKDRIKDDKQLVPNA